jgi:MHS family proline/betaine transporter-like MFS transporter
MHKETKYTLAAVAGTALEFYDFTLYGVFAVVIAQQFFPATDPVAAFLLSLLVYAVGSIMRPLGGFVFGRMGDRWGRKPALLTSILCMAVATTTVGFLPSYAEIGIFAPIILVMCRLFQGLSAGGEFNNAAIFSIEHIGYHRSGFVGSLVVAGGTVGTLMAMGLGYFVTTYFPTFGWRIPFLLGSVIGILGLYIRRSVEESPAYVQEQTTKTPSRSSRFKEIWTHHRPDLLRTVGIGGFASALGFTVFNYVNIYLNKHVGFQMNKSMLFNVFGLVLFVGITPIMGYLADKIGPKRIMLFSCITTTASIIPIYCLLSSGETVSILQAQIWMVILSCSFSGPMHALLIHFFPAELRCLGISFGFSAGIALFGGTLPLISSALIEKTHNMLSPAYYLMGVGFMAVVALWSAQEVEKKTR